MSKLYYNILNNKHAQKSLCVLIIMLFSSFSFSQTTAINQLQQQLNSYQSQNIQEKIFVHTDKSFYVNGEIIWFKIYNVLAADHKPSELSKVAYVELLNQGQKPVLQAKIALDEGTGSGSLVVPSSIRTGNYILRAYTNWMKNFSPDFYFEKVLTIVNTLKRPDWVSLEKAESYSVQFFPEGGNMVYGLQSKVAFHVADQYGKGLECKGFIISQNNDTVASFNTLKFGNGTFYFTPKKGYQYKAIIQPGGNKIITSPFPDIYDKGYVMSVQNRNKDSLNIRVTTNLQDAPVYLIIHSKQKIILAQASELESGKTDFIINKSILNDGISYLTLFNEARQPVCERLYFKQPREKMMIAAQPDRLEYDTRSKVTMAISTSDERDVPLSGNLSLSIFLLDSLQSTDPTNIYNYLWLSSELKGIIESPDYYFNNSGPEADQTIDNLMLTNGWRRFRWEEVLQETKPSFEFLPEYEGLVINGKVIDKRTGNSVPNVTAYLSIPGERFHVSNAVSDQNGEVRFVVKDVYGLNELVVQTVAKTDSNYRVELFNPYSEKYSYTILPHFELEEKWQGQLIAHSTNTQVQNVYENDKQPFLLPSIDIEAFYGVPDRRYFLDDYTRFPTMEEVIREYVIFVRLRKDNDGFHFEVQNAPYQVSFSDDPLVLIDGVPVFDVKKIIAFDPLKIKKIDVVARKYFWGNTVNKGIVSYFTYKGDLANFELDPNAVVLEYQGLQLKREFYSPVYDNPEKQQSRLADLRNVLTWNPEIRTDQYGKQSISFYTSDLKGNYALLIEGMSNTGLPGSVVKMITVK
jgi:hypothetical protein